MTWYSFSVAPQIPRARNASVGCEVRILPSSWAHRHLWRSFYLPRPAWRWRRAYPVYAAVASYLSLASLPFVRILLRNRPDVLLVQEYSTGRFDVLLLLSRAMRVPLIAYHAGSSPERYVGRLLKRWTIPRADLLMVSSQQELDLLARRYGVSRDRVRVVLTPIDTALFRPRERALACRETGLDAARRYLLFVGRLDDRIKRVSALIRAFALVAGEHPDVDLLVVGDGPDAYELRRLAGACAPGRVRFLGWLAEAPSLARVYSAAECVVLPSQSEGFPAVVGEALACGTPVVASRVGGVGELVLDGETGWLIAPGDEQGLTTRLSFVLANPEVVESIRPRARSLAESRLSPAVVAAELRECFQLATRP